MCSVIDIIVKIVCRYHSSYECYTDAAGTTGPMNLTDAADIAGSKNATDATDTSAAMLQRRQVL